MKSAVSISDFKITDDGGKRRVSVFGMGWTGYTVSGYGSVFVPSFDGLDADEAAEKAQEVADEAEEIASMVVFDSELENMAHYFYNLGRQHGMEAVAEEMNKIMS
jgi:hypothetical protein